MSHTMAIVAVDGSYDEDELEKAVEEQMAPFDENGEWFRDGSRWDWWMVGGRYSGRLATEKETGLDFVRKKDLCLEAIRKGYRERAARAWEEASKKWPDDPGLREAIYGIKSGQTREEYIADRANFPLSAHTFLMDLEWHESGRMGWWGAAATPESGEEEGVSVCVSTHKRLRQAKIVTHNNLSQEEWAEKFFEMFIKPLPEDAWIVVVDYHV